MIFISGKQFMNIMYYFMALMCCLVLFIISMDIMSILHNGTAGFFGIILSYPYSLLIPCGNGVLFLITYKLAKKHRKQMEAAEWR